MASSELEDPKLFELAESHQAMVLHPTTSGMIFTIMITVMMILVLNKVVDVLSPCEVKLFQVRHVGVDVLEDALVRRQVPQLTALQAQVSEALWEMLEGYFFSVDVTVMQLKRCQTWC